MSSRAYIQSVIHTEENVLNGHVVSILILLIGLIIVLGNGLRGGIG